jgi:xanthine dehydrogenase YagS FAD-binding subunit
MHGETIAEARLALGGVAHKPWRDLEAELMLKGEKAAPEKYRLVAEHILREAKGYRYNAFKIELAKRAVIRALTMASGGRNP